MEGNGIFAQKQFVKNTPLCNYGGIQVTKKYAEKYLLPFEDKCDYVVELCETTDDGMKRFNLNCHPRESKTFGQLLNHSSLHPNALTMIYTTGKINWKFYLLQNMT